MVKNEISVEGSEVMLVFRPVGRTRAKICPLTGRGSSEDIPCVASAACTRSQLFILKSAPAQKQF